MKKFYPFIFLVLSALPFALHAQVTIIDNNHSLSGYPVFGNSIFLTSDEDSTLWKSDGTPGGTLQFATNVKIDLDHGIGFLNNKIYFAGVDASHGSELWITDGTAVGTKLVQDLLTGTKGSKPDDFVLYKSDLYFTDSSTSGRELYRISGTNGSVSLFKDINPGTGNAFDENNTNFLVSNGLLYFQADDGTNGTELWVSDGTSGNTKMLKNISAGNTSTNFSGFITLNNQLIFTVITTTYSLDLWKTDGTNTTLIKSFNVPYSAISSFGLLNFNNKIYFAGTDVTNGTELWSTDGTAASMVKDIFSGNDAGVPNSSYPQLFNAVFINGHFLFSANDDNGVELWSSDGTAANTVRIKDINPGVESSNPVLYPVIDYSKILDGGSIFDFYSRGTLLNGYIFFSADDGTHGTQLWKTNGTAAGTTLVESIGAPNYGVTDTYFYTKTGLYFSANDGTKGNEPWFTNGTTVQMVADINPGSGSSDPDFTFVFNNKLFGTVDNGVGTPKTDFYRIDATVSVLPVSLLNFKATLQSEAVQLDWTTATEINSNNFAIQRSTDGINFSEIGSVMAAGNSTIEKSYSFADIQYLEAGSDVLYYRLQLNDKDGKNNYSQVQIVKLNASATFLKTYPNPVHSQLSVLFSAASSKITILRISDLNGKELYRQNFGMSQICPFTKYKCFRFSKRHLFYTINNRRWKQNLKVCKAIKK